MLCKHVALFPHNTLYLIMQGKKCSLANAFDDGCHLRQFCHPPDVVGDVVCKYDDNDNDDAPPPPNKTPTITNYSFCLHSLVDDVVPLRRHEMGCC